MPMVTEQTANALALRLFGRYCELGDTARLNNATLAELASVSRARLGQLRKSSEGDQATSLGLVTFLRMYQLIPRLEQGLKEGWLPATSTRGKAQGVALERVLAGGAVDTEVDP